MHHIVMIIYDRGDPDSKRRARCLMEELVAEGAKVGMGEYRTHLALQDQVMGTYSWNNNALLRLNNKIKDALNPNGVYAPGKSGIWGRCWDNRDSGPSRVSASSQEPHGQAALADPKSQTSPEDQRSKSRL
jgi:hypothetical protein